MGQFVGLVSILWMTVAFAAPSSQNGASGSRAETIQITGNRRTSESTILRAAAIVPGDYVTDERLQRIRQRLMNLRIFSDVRVFWKDHRTRSTLVMEVTERWTLIPIPMVMVSGGDLRIGGFLLESNFLGRNRKLGFGGMYQEGASMAFALYEHPAFLGTRSHATVRFGFFRGHKERYDEDQIVDAFRDRTQTLIGLLGYPVLPSLRVSMGAFFVSGKSQALKNYRVPKVREGIFGPALEVLYEGQDYHLFVNQGLRMLLRYQHSFAALGSGRDALFAYSEILHTTVTKWTHAIALAFVGHWRQGNPRLEMQRVGGRRGFRGFPLQGIWLSQGGAITADYAIPFLEAFGGTWTASVYVDTGVAVWKDVDIRFCHPGVGFRFYLRDIALPALGFDLVLNTREMKVVPGAAIGLGF